MVRRHNSRDYSKHRKKTIRDYDEYYKVEIFSFEHNLTKIFLPADVTTVSHAKKSTHRSLHTYMSDDKKSNFQIKFDYFVEMLGEYRIDIVYESFTKKHLAGNISIIEGDVKFEGSINHSKRKTLFTNFNKLGNKTITLTMPPNVYFYGIIIRKIKEYNGDNLASAGTNLMLKDVDFTSSSQIGVKEASFTIGYDNSFETLTSTTGLYMDYNDEVNIYMQAKDATEETQIFGGYISSIQPDDDKTKLDISCADRLVDGQNRYILTKMRLLGGTAQPSENEYNKQMDIDFQTYGRALKYLCNCLEITLNNNIGKNDLVTRETAEKGFNIEFGKKKSIKKVKTTNSTSKVSKNFIMLRNNASASKKQTMILYDGKSMGRSKPVEITDYDNFGIVYGLGEPKQEHDEKTTTSVSNSTSGSQKFSKCGVSQDGKYIMAIGRASAYGELGKYGYDFYKKVYKRKCPACGSEKLFWGIFWAGNESTNMATFPCTGRVEGGSADGHVFCQGCDADWSIFGKPHGGTSKHLEGVSKLVSASKSEAYQLKEGKVSAVPTSASSLSADDIFKEISQYAFKNFRYVLEGNTTTTASGLEKKGVGDCWAFSEWIFNQLKKHKVNCRVVQYASESPVHRSVQYKNKKNKWTNFPYRSYGWGSKYNNKLNDTIGNRTPDSVPFKYTAGGTIEQATGGSGSSTETTTVKVITGYNRDTPLQGYFELTLSTKQSFKAETKTIQVGFTQKAGTTNSMTGFNTVWINDTVRQANVNIMDFVKDSIYRDYDDKYKYYLHSIKFIAPRHKVVDTEKTTDSNKPVYKIEDWYTYDKSTHDEASGKMDLYSINFNNATLINPTDLDSCGKNITSLFEELLSASKYTVSMKYSKHRCDDVINFSVDNKTEADYTAHEGDENNILDIGGISFAPRNNLFNNSTVVFKSNDNHYKYVDTRNAESMMKYGEQMTLSTSSEIIGSKEAYYNAMNNSKFNPVETFSFTLTLPYFVAMNVGDLVKVIADSKKLNTVKTVSSVKYIASNSKIPKIQTQLGLGELPMDLQINKELREIRALTKKESTVFSSTAEAIDDDVYVWDT